MLVYDGYFLSSKFGIVFANIYPLLEMIGFNHGLNNNV